MNTGLSKANINETWKDSNDNEWLIHSVYLKLDQILVSRSAKNDDISSTKLICIDAPGWEKV